ncbi:peptidase [Pseudomonas nicosulfuronedens]|uniref:peptidase n=1 Tax=Pseudomonas nicosulfuronedens TaxID=2571105 RepID=UPI00244C6F2F|nr:peptidase [Pseudomonas nicosulfuronedens]MDH1007417.1 peptidase [Pseudomonas nicosulfuronedens]MDH1977463.1 peptidase [Pseudomonas nicosulfuronedens]MDH2029011.1 peptidase [Pseudomonas nicosulfuronedens]
MKPLHIFKPGKHTAMSGADFNFSESDLAATVRAYDPALHEAPLVLGHPKHDAPAGGWVQSLQHNADGLLAEPSQVDPAFAELIDKGRFKKISASFYHPDSPSNPVPGVYYLRHVGFLGSMPPAVKGLRPIELAEDEEGVVEFADFGHETSASLWRRLRDWLISDRGLEVADQVIPDWQINTLAETARRDDEPRPAFTEPTPPATIEESTVTPEEIAAIQAENERLKGQVQQHQEQQLKTRQESIHATNVAFAEELVGAGKLLPKHTTALIAALDFAEAGDTPLEFGEGDDRQPVVDGLKAIFKDLPDQISFAEQARKDRQGAAESIVDPEFAEKNTDPDRLDLHQRATALAADKGIPYESAVRQLIK